LDVLRSVTYCLHFVSSGAPAFSDINTNPHRDHLVDSAV